jgi:hypothetical protein
MIKLLNLLNELNLPKNTWQPLSSSELKDLESDIFNLIQTAYSDIGGHPNYKTVSDLAGSDYNVINLDDDPEIDAVTITKNRSGGIKHVGIGHDGTNSAKRSTLLHTIIQLGKNNNYIEASGRVSDILLKAKVTQVTNKETIEKALKGKEIQMYDDGSYSRYLGGKKYIKMMFGKPTV